MNIFKLSLLLGATSMIGCIGTGTGDKADCDSATEICDTDVDTDMDTDDTDTTMECDTTVAAPVLSDWTAACVGGEIVITSRTDNWSTDAVVYMAQTGVATLPWEEEHDLLESDHSECEYGTGAYSQWEVSLTPDAATPGDVVPGESSLLSCADIDGTGAGESNVTWAVQVSDLDSAAADCIVFGDNPDCLISNTGCTFAGGQGGITVPAWVAGCEAAAE